MDKRNIFTYILMGILLVISCLMAFVLNKQSAKLEIAEHNVKALTDTITEVRLKNGELLNYKNSLVIDKKELEASLDISKKEVKELEKQLKQKIKYISKIEINSHIDTVNIPTIVYMRDSATYRYGFGESNQYYVIEGYVDVDSTQNASTTITRNDMNINMKVGLDDDWKIFAITDNPYVSISNLEGAMLNKNEYLKKEGRIKVITWGFHVGFGVNYDIRYGGFGYGPNISVGMNINPRKRIK